MMKTLYESLLDDEEEVMSRIGKINIEEFLQSNYKIEGTHRVQNRVIDINGNVFLISDKITHLTDGTFKFGKVTGDFNLYMGGSNLIDLEGGPEYVGGAFNAYGLYDLKTLKGAPRIVKDTFDCSETSIASLEGAPKEVHGVFDCTGCWALKDISNLPKHIKSLRIDKDVITKVPKIHKYIKDHNVPVFNQMPWDNL